MTVDGNSIQLSGVRVNNLQNVSVRIPWHQLTVVCGLSGSGKSSLAFDTLFAEGQRRYVETFSPYTRQFLDCLERPDADRIEGIPPAIAIRQNAWAQQSQGTVGSRTEIYDFLRSLFVRWGTEYCPECAVEVRAWNPQTVAQHLSDAEVAGRIMVAFPSQEAADVLLSRGFTRVLQSDRSGLAVVAVEEMEQNGECLVVADRLKPGPDSRTRLVESLATAFFEGGEQCCVLTESTVAGAELVSVDHSEWYQSRFSREPVCSCCQRAVAHLNDALLNYRSLGQCSVCQGQGTVATFDLEAVADMAATVEGGAVLVWQEGPGRRQQKQVLESAAELGLRTGIPLAELSVQERRILQHGVAGSSFDGLDGLYQRCLESRAEAAAKLRKKWNSISRCSACNGTRLNEDARAVKLNEVSIADVLDLSVSRLSEWLQSLAARLPDVARSSVLRQLRNRVSYLDDCGLGYVASSRALSTLSGGERQRVALTSALGSGLINTLFVLDEPTAGLHSSDASRVIRVAEQLRDCGNTVVVVEHHPDFIRAADHVVETGPAAGREGGQIVFEGRAGELVQSQTPTGKLLSRLTPGEALQSPPRRRPSGWLRFDNATCHNVIGVSGALPLGVVCAVTGVSGSGKSSLLVETLYPAICRHLGLVLPGQSGSVTLADVPEDLTHVQLLTQAVMRGNRRSIPVTVIQCFAEIRKVFAQTREAKKRNFGMGMFSFNSSGGGRCEHCDGRGVLQIEMQFLPDIEAVCDACGGSRYRKDVLEVEYRNRSIHEVLQMTADEAFTFFKGARRVQSRLNALRLAGLGYLTLGQPVSTLSGGESQRLRIAAVLAGAPSEDELPRRRSATSAGGTLFILDEPSTGLHGQNVDRLVECLNHLVETGHSVVAIDHNPLLVAAAHHVIEMGPGPGEGGGRIVTGAHE